MSDQVPVDVLHSRVNRAAASDLKGFPVEESPEQIRTRALSAVNSSKLPEGKVCGDCCNFESYCRLAFPSSAGPLNRETDICAYTPSRFNDPLHVEGRLKWRHKPR